MTQFPYQKWFETDFSSDPFVKDLPFLARCVWRAVLQTMWLNGGWLPADEHACARLLGCDVRTWKAWLVMLSPGLRREVDHLRRVTLRQHRVDLDWQIAVDLDQKNKARTAAATAERLKKSNKPTNVTSGATPQRNVQRHAQRNVSSPALARSPSPYTPSPKSGDGDGPPTPREETGYVQPPASRCARSPATDGLSLARSGSAGPALNGDDEAIAKKFGPGPRAANTPAFLQAWEKAQAGDASALTPKPGAPLHATTTPDKADDPIERANEKFKPTRPPPGTLKADRDKPH